MALQVRNDARLAGRVARYHTWPHIKEQTVAEHTWQLLRILLVIWAEVPANVMGYVVRHDCGEIKTGDAPYPVKAENSDIAAGMNRVEHDSLIEQVSAGFLRLGPDVSDEERWAVKLAEFIEMWEWGEEELLMGNQFAKLVAQRCRAIAQERIREQIDSRVPGLKMAVAQGAADYMRKRIALWEL